MKVDNFNQIKTLLTFNSCDEFYFLQILKRRKENPEIGSNSTIIKTYYISSINYLTEKEEEIKTLCKLYNARAYINLTSRSYERIAFHNLKKITDCIMNKDFKSIKNSYDSVCGSYGFGEKRWVVDIDGKLNSYIEIEINMIEPKGDKILAVIPTLNGVHLITKPFNLQKFKELYPLIDVHKNNPTLLYYEKN